MSKFGQIIKSGSKGIFEMLRQWFASAERTTRINVVAPQATEEEWLEIKKRAIFYFPAAKNIVFSRRFNFSFLFSPAPILLFNITLNDLPFWAKLHVGIFNIDHQRNAMDGWYWCEAATYAYGIAGREGAQARLLARLKILRTLDISKKCYVFGTGPSLGQAIQKDWSDGVRIVCNTIVRDQELWRHIKPHLFVAADAIYHFGFTEFACQFRRDLHSRMKESDVLFIYPEYFDFLVQREFGEFTGRLVPMPNGLHTTIHNDFALDFSLPPLGNVLNKMLLPIACNVSKNVGLWGFDGRAPTDQLFWSNSQKQSYTELLPTLQEAHPAFFDHFVPRDNPEKYVNSVHGDVLEYLLSSAEKEGWHFQMLHKSWTPTLSRRELIA